MTAPILTFDLPRLLIMKMIFDVSMQLLKDLRNCRKFINDI